MTYGKVMKLPYLLPNISCLAKLLFPVLALIFSPHSISAKFSEASYLIDMNNYVSSEVKWAIKIEGYVRYCAQGGKDRNKYLSESEIGTLESIADKERSRVFELVEKRLAKDKKIPSADYKNLIIYPLNRLFHIQASNNYFAQRDFATGAGATDDRSEAEFCNWTKSRIIKKAKRKNYLK